MFRPLVLSVITVVCLGACTSKKSTQTGAGPEDHAAHAEDANAESVPAFQIDVRPEPTAASPQETAVRLTDVAEQLGMRHEYVNGGQGKALLAETIGGGCGWLDFNCDGWPDLYANQGGDPTVTASEAQPLDQLFVNVAGESFRNVAADARIREFHYSQAVAIGDFDNDGLDDIYVTNVGKNTLWWNCGDGTFQEVSQSAAVADVRWSVSAAWADLDRDGDLDLYVCNYCDYDPRDPVECKTPVGGDMICNPADLAAWPDACFVNQGDGTFHEAAHALGLFGDGNRALGVAIADFDNDGWPDVYVANDTTDNFLFMNQGDGRFADEAKLRGCAVDRSGTPQGSMGVAVGDYDNNGYLDIYSTHYYEEPNTLYANFGESGFRDMTALAGLHRPTLPLLGFGAVFTDFDCDSLPELLVANGHVNNAVHAEDPKMRAQLFAADRSRSRWHEIGTEASSYFQDVYMGRAVALADYDLDGDVDAAIVNQNDPTAMLRNDSDVGSWLELSFCGRESNRRGIGVRVAVQFGVRSFTQQLVAGASYAATGEPMLHFGLGDYQGTVQARVSWPSGVMQIAELEVNQPAVLVEPTR